MFNYYYYYYYYLTSIASDFLKPYLYKVFTNVLNFIPKAVCLLCIFISLYTCEVLRSQDHVNYNYFSLCSCSKPDKGCIWLKHVADFV